MGARSTWGALFGAAAFLFRSYFSMKLADRERAARRRLYAAAFMVCALLTTTVVLRVVELLDRVSIWRAAGGAALTLLAVVVLLLATKGRCWTVLAAIGVVRAVNDTIMPSVTLLRLVHLLCDVLSPKKRGLRAGSLSLPSITTAVQHHLGVPPLWQALLPALVLTTLSARLGGKFFKGFAGASWKGVFQFLLVAAINLPIGKHAFDGQEHRIISLAVNATLAIATRSMLDSILVSFVHLARTDNLLSFMMNAATTVRDMRRNTPSKWFCVALLLVRCSVPLGCSAALVWGGTTGALPRNPALAAAATLGAVCIVEVVVGRSGLSSLTRLEFLLGTKALTNAWNKAKSVPLTWAGALRNKIRSWLQATHKKCD